MGERTIKGDNPVATQRRFSDTEWLLLTTPDDTEEAPWMVMPETQWRIVALLMSILRLHVRRAGKQWHLGADVKITMPRAIIPRTLDLAPDLMMVEADDAPRTSWNVIREGRVPAFVLEVVTEESWDRDTVEKPLLYEAMGVREYVIFAPQRRDDGPILFGYRRDEENHFAPWKADERGILWCATLDGLGLYAEQSDGWWLRVRDQRGERLPSAEEVAARADEEAAARRAAEAEVARLRALLEDRSR